MNSSLGSEYNGSMLLQIGWPLSPTLVSVGTTLDKLEPIRPGWHTICAL